MADQKTKTEARIRDILTREFGEGKTPAAVVAALRAMLSLAKYNRSGVAADNTMQRIATPLGVKVTTVRKKNFRDEVYDCPRYIAADGHSCDAYGGDVVED